MGLEASLMFRIDDNPWIGIKDGDRRALDLYLRHYSAVHYRDGRVRSRFVGPGERVVLLTLDCKALLVWRRCITLDAQQGIYCSIFRNEGPFLASYLLESGEVFARRRWPDETRLFTYVSPGRIRSTNPGYCFLMAGWRRCWRSKGGLVILEKALQNDA